MGTLSTPLDCVLHGRDELRYWEASFLAEFRAKICRSSAPDSLDFSGAFHEMGAAFISVRDIKFQVART